MSNRLNCTNCGARIDLPAGFARAKIRCGSCGYYTEVPASLRAPADEDDAPASPPTPPPAPPPARKPAIADDDDDTGGTYGVESAPVPKPAAPRPKPKKAAKVMPQADPQDARPRFDTEGADTGTPLLDGSQDEDDDKPYAVPGTGLKRCPECRGELPLSATLCVHCGTEIETKKKSTRTFQSINKQWDEGWGLQLRLQMLVAIIIVDVVAFLILWFKGELGFFEGFIGMLPNVALQVFLLGSFDSLAIKRTPKGQATLLRTRRIGFFEFPPSKLKWKQSEGIGIAGSHNPGVFSWLICAYMALFCIIPGVLFYWFVIRPARFDVNLCDVYGSTDEVVFHTQDRTQAEEIASTISEATGLMYKRAL